MKNGKFLFLAMIFLVGLVCISAVSAADEAASDVIADTNDETVLEESIDDAIFADSPTDELDESDENVVGDGETPSPLTPSFALLSDKITNSDELILDDDYSYTYSDGDFQKGINITHNVTVKGNGHKIDGQETARIFYVQNNVTVILEDINFVNGNSSMAAAIYCSRGSNVTILNCNFTANHADSWSGAVYADNSKVTAVNCIFKENLSNYCAGATCDITAIACTFENNAANVTFSANTGSGGAMFGGTAINCNFINNSADVGGACYAVNVSNCYFTGNVARRSGGACYSNNAVNSTFYDNHANWYGGAICSVVATDCDFIKNSALDSGGAMTDSTATNCNFNNNSAVKDGGAFAEGTAINCAFNDNYAENNGGAIVEGTAVNCTFDGNIGNENGGAIYNGAAVNCKFTNNEAVLGRGGAIYNGNATNCTFNKNKAFQNEGGAIYNGSAVNCTFNANIASDGGAIYLGYAENCTFTNNRAEFSGGAMSGNYFTNERCYATNCIFSGNVAPTFGTPGDDNGGAIYLGAADSCVFNGDSCKDVINYLPTLSVDQFTSTYNSGDKVVVNLKTHGGMPIVGAKIVISVYTSAGVFVGNYNALSNVGWKVPFNAGSYKATYIAQDFNMDSEQGLILINKAKSTITSKAVTTVYNNNKYLVITLKDNKGKALSGAKVTVTLASAKTYTTDKNGQIKINVAKLVPKTYNAKISFAGNANYLASSKTVKVTVKKAAAKMTAKKKTFKAKVKVKKYTITLKNNVKKAIKGVKVTLKVNKKTFKAKTNKKGKAVFKIKNLKKKGTYKAVIKFAGDKYYKKLTKKVKIKVKK